MREASVLPYIAVYFAFVVNSWDDVVAAFLCLAVQYYLESNEPPHLIEY